MIMEIYCNKCKKEVGELIKSKIKKGTIFICPSCAKQKASSEELKKAADALKKASRSGKPPTGFEDIFKDMGIFS
jgi:uncharacterized Zn finger protein (UPF0148 family)